MAIWFTANAFGNKLAGSLSALYPEGGKVTNFMGYKMSNLYDFFMLFVFMSFIAALFLFLLTRKLQKMMQASNAWLHYQSLSQMVFCHKDAK